ncbi:hypothetical protein HZS_1721 [Henneguya salminicola]|uniref:Heat shock 70 kDa protein 13 (Trinotate prediction) n=1 Tax=Henneguya salminicola TaxID=69463 RepID=A0A6G3MG26_HENSL|nr:hypothetical protein HZS_1721 [Henneguya salminicola]
MLIYSCLLVQTDNKMDFINFEYEYFLDIIENAKISLSLQKSINFTFTKNTKLWHLETTREEFEECNKELFHKLLLPIELALSEAKLTVDDIQEIVLVGGATRMPELRRIVSEYFNREPNKYVDPDTAVVIGLANQAGIITQGWPLEKSAIDIIPEKIKKIKIE